MCVVAGGGSWLGRVCARCCEFSRVVEMDFGLKKGRGCVLGMNGGRPLPRAKTLAARVNASRLASLLHLFVVGLGLVNASTLTSSFVVACHSNCSRRCHMQHLVREMNHQRRRGTMCSTPTRRQSGSAVLHKMELRHDADTSIQRYSDIETYSRILAVTAPFRRM